MLNVTLSVIFKHRVSPPPAFIYFKPAFCHCTFITYFALEKWLIFIKSQEINEPFFKPRSTWWRLKTTRDSCTILSSANSQRFWCFARLILCDDGVVDWGLVFQLIDTIFAHSTHTPSPRQTIDLQRRAAEVASARIHGNKRSLLHKKTFAIFSNIITRNGRRTRRRRRFFFLFLLVLLPLLCKYLCWVAKNERQRCCWRSL